MPRPGLAAGDHPVDAVELEADERAKQRLGTVKCTAAGTWRR
jgi:hypothetical protein